MSAMENFSQLLFANSTMGDSLATLTATASIPEMRHESSNNARAAKL
jgi:hypothetical protein